MRAQYSLAIIGPTGTRKSHTLIGLKIAAVHAGHEVRHLTAIDLVETLYRGMADDTVGKIIDTTLRQNLIIVDEMGFAPLDNTGTQLLFRLVARAYDRRYLAIASPWSFAKGGPTPARTHYRRQHPRPAPTSRHHLHPQRFLPRDPPNGGAPPLNQTALGEDFHLAIVFAA